MGILYTFCVRLSRGLVVVAIFAMTTFSVIREFLIGDHFADVRRMVIAFKYNKYKNICHSLLTNTKTCAIIYVQEERHEKLLFKGSDSDA